MCVYLILLAYHIASNIVFDEGMHFWPPTVFSVCFHCLVLSGVFYDCGVMELVHDFFSEF